jgi:hypothetical protein
MRALRPAPLLAAAALALGLAGCQPKTLYAWNGYDETVYRHYKNPQDREAWVEALKTAILENEQEGRKMPPGLYAEYGYALYEEGAFPQAIVYFQKEKEKWPESRLLMEKMIRNAERQAGRPSPARAPASTQGPAGALEKAP